MNTMSEKVKNIMATVIDCSITREMAMEVLRVKYDWLYPYVTNGVWDEHYGLYLKSKGLLFETKCGCVIQRNSREHDECRCDEDGENWICAGCYNGEYDEEEAEPECCGKHCDETEGLKLGMGWNRWHSSVKDMITDQLWCENCYKDCVGRECKSCSEYYPYTEMTYHKGGAFGEPCMDLAMFFCKSCVDKINSIDYYPDEEETKPKLVSCFPSNQLCRHCEEKPILRGESLCRDCFLNNDEEEEEEAEPDEEAEPEWNPNGIEIKDDDSGLCNVCNKWQPICKFQEDDIIKQPCKDCFCDEKETKYTCEECGTHDEDEVGISTGTNGIEKRVCECCDIDGSNYSGWGDEITSDK
jgi:hypothetical protein